MVHYFVLLLVYGLLGLSLLLLPFFSAYIEGSPEVFAVLPANEQGIAILLPGTSSTWVISEYKEFI